MSEKKPTLDELDKRIIQSMSRGFHSYDELAKNLHVTRSTIYRRIRRLEKVRIISRQIMGVPDFTRLGLSAILIGMNIAHEDLAAATDVLVKQDDVKLVWKSYGSHDIIVAIVCEKGCEGKAIFDLREKLAKLRITGFDYSIGFNWEKVDFSPY
jgi:DNA-binding Lrp family transcriptional regulator